MNEMLSILLSPSRTLRWCSKPVIKRLTNSGCFMLTSRRFGGSDLSVFPLLSPGKSILQTLIFQRDGIAEILSAAEGEIAPIAYVGAIGFPERRRMLSPFRNLSSSSCSMCLGLRCLRSRPKSPTHYLSRGSIPPSPGGGTVISMPGTRSPTNECLLQFLPQSVGEDGTR